MTKLVAKSNAYPGYMKMGQNVVQFTDHYMDGRAIDRSPVIFPFEEFAGRREGKSTNYRYTKNGVPNWRDPSSYRRSVSEVRVIRGEQEWVNPNPNPNDPNSLVKITWRGGPYAGPALNNVCWPTYYAGNAPYPDYDSLTVLNVVNRADTECLVKLGSKKAEIALTLAEAKKSFDLLVDGATTLFRVAIAVKRGNIPLALRTLGVNPRGIGKRYLQYVYGVKPLAYDIYGAYRFFSEGLETRPRIKATRTVREQFQVDGPLGWKSRMGKYNTGSLSVRTHLEAVLTDQYLHAANSAGILNPASVLWELTPWSFVIDWALPIGTLIEACTAASGLVFHSGWRTAVLESEGDWYQPAPSWWDNAPTNCGFHVANWSFRRDPLSKFPRPAPFVISPFKTGKAMNALALLTQLVK